MIQVYQIRQETFDKFETWTHVKNMNLKSSEKN